MASLRRLGVLGVVALILVATGSLAQTHEGHQHPPHDDDATISHRFGDAETWAAHFEDPERDAWQLPDKIVATLVADETMRIADIGSATGYFPVRFAKACPEGIVIGADIEPDMVYYLNDRARTEGLSNLVSVLAAADDPHLPITVDLVFICNTYHHINDRIEYFTRLKGQLRDEGRVAVVDYRPSSKRGPPHKLAAEAVESEMAESGYVVVGRHDFLPEQYFLVFREK